MEEEREYLVAQPVDQGDRLLEVRACVVEQPVVEVQAGERVQLAGGEQLIAGLPEALQRLQANAAFLLAGRADGEVPQQLADQVNVTGLARDRDSLLRQSPPGARIMPVVGRRGQLAERASLQAAVTQRLRQQLSGRAEYQYLPAMSNGLQPCRPVDDGTE